MASLESGMFGLSLRGNKPPKKEKPIKKARKVVKEVVGVLQKV